MDKAIFEAGHGPLIYIGKLFEQHGARVRCCRPSSLPSRERKPGFELRVAVNTRGGNERRRRRRGVAVGEGYFFFLAFNFTID